MSPVVLDTDVASALLRHRTPDTLARQLAVKDYVDYAEHEGLVLLR